MASFKLNVGSIFLVVLAQGVKVLLENSKLFSLLVNGRATLRVNQVTTPIGVPINIDLAKKSNTCKV